MKQKDLVLPKKEIYSDQEVNEMAEWVQDLSLKQLFFLKESYESMLKIQACEFGGNGYVH